MLQPEFSKKFLLVEKINDQLAHESCIKICDYLLKNYHAIIYFEEPVFEVFRTNEHTNFKIYDNKTCEVDFIITLGGDGTVLWAIGLMETKEIPPIFSVKLGGLSFINKLYHEDIFNVLEYVLQNDNKNKLNCETLSLLEIFILNEKNNLVKKFLALNELVVIENNFMKICDFTININDKFFKSVKSDGIVLTTPTGSTAFNLSVGGPLVHQSMDCIVLNLVASHTLSNRPLVLPKDLKITIMNDNITSSEVALYVDGRKTHNLAQNEKIVLYAANKKVNLILPENGVENLHLSWFSSISEIFRWGEPVCFSRKKQCI